MKGWALAVAVVAAVAVALSVVVTLLVRDSEDSAPSAGPGRPGTQSSGPAVEPAARIELGSPSYFGRPFETIRLTGRYHGARTPRTLRLQVRQDAGWTQFPLPAVTAPSGRFRAYVELGTGQYLVRLVDPDQDKASRAVPVLVF